VKINGNKDHLSIGWKLREGYVMKNGHEVLPQVVCNKKYKYIISNFDKHGNITSNSEDIAVQVLG
jgi:hypothetical protein